MQRLLSFTVATGVAAQQDCHATSASASDSWCDANCNHNPPNCPASLCACDAPAPNPPSPSPSPSPSPGPSPAPTPPAVDFPIFQLDLFMNDPNAGWQETGFPPYLLNDAAKYMNVAGISFIQPADLMDDAYDLPTEVGNAVGVLRAQGVQVQLLVGGEFSRGWSDLQANPHKAATNAIKLMQNHGVGIQVDDEAGGDSARTILFIKLCHAGKPATSHLSMDVGGTPSGFQQAVFNGAMAELQFVNMMVSAPQYDQGNSVKFGMQYGIPPEKLVVAYYAGTWVDNCNSMGAADSFQNLGYGKTLVDRYGLKGLSIWAVGGASYAGCPTGTDGPQGFAQTMAALGAHTPPAPAPAPAPPAPAPGPAPPAPGPGPAPPAPTPTPSGSTFVCMDSQCVAAEGGVSSDICSQLCTPALYTCRDNQCVPSSSGGLPLETCSAICGGSLLV